MVHKKITLELVKDPCVGGYTIFSEDFPSVIAEGGDINEALQNFAEALIVIEKIKEDKKNGKTIGDIS